MRRSYSVTAVIGSDAWWAALLPPAVGDGISVGGEQGWCSQSLVGSGLKETCFHVNAKTIYLSP